MPKRIRLPDQEEAFYHITTRVVDRIYRFTPEENERNVKLLRRVEGFSGVQVIAYCFMSNHIHLLLRVPPREQITKKELLRRIGILYGKKEAVAIGNQWQACQKDHADLVAREQKKYLLRMYDMGAFMKTLKQRLSISYNARSERVGTLWEDRYHSVLLEPTESVLSAVAAYIELNPVRAKMVSDPKDYRFSSYGEACRGGVEARAGICCIYREGEHVPTWKEVAPRYRLRVVLKAVPTEKRAGMTPEAIQRVLENKGTLPLSEIISDRVRFFSQGFTVGSDAFFAAIRKKLLEGKPLTTFLPLKE